MKRRDFLKFSGCGLVAVTVGGAGGWNLFSGGAVAHAGTLAIDLTMVEADAEMVDGIQVRMWAYSTTLQAGNPAAPLGARIPGPIIFATEGDTIRIRVFNQISKGGAHGFSIPGVVDAGPVPYDNSPAAAGVTIEFPAPAPGTYMYLDPFNAPVNRVMGLHGALVVLPKPVGNNTPYSNPTANVQRLFDDLGTTDHFPGHPWDFDRNGIWIFNTVDPDRNEEAFNSNDGIDPLIFRPLGPASVTNPNRYLPQYFTLNGKSGFFSAQHGEMMMHEQAGSPDAQASISIHGNVGQPVVLRNLNAGLMWHAPHIHGNHVYVLSENGTVLDNLKWLDTWAMAPGAVTELLLPYIMPPDIPPATRERFAQGQNQELFPWLFPMHDHNEISNTAAGGNYPQGLATHFQFDGLLSLADEVITVTRAEVRLRTGQVLIEGRSSGAANTILEIHAGPDMTGPVLGTTTVGANGTWTFRGRALKALGTRTVTVHSMNGAERRSIPLKIR